MKKINHFMIAGAALLMLAGCSTDELSGNSEGQIPVRLSVSQQTATMRAADGLYTNTTGFDGNEQVEVYVNSNDKHATFTVGTPDVEHKSELTGTLYYPTSGNANLYAVYPAASATAGSHTVKYNQTTAANYKASDLMYATKTVTQANKTSTQDLQFSHQLVKLKVVIIKAADVSQVTKVEMKNVKRKATVSLSTSALTLSSLTTATGDDATEGDNILVFSGSNTSTETQTYAVVFPVQSWSNQDFITVTADGKEATYKLTKDNFAAGSEYTLTLNINAAALDNTVSITNWTGPEGSFNVNPTTVIETKLEAVDIGMHVGGSSSTVLKWANMNVGASSETDYGSYFFWAGVAGYGGAKTSGTVATDGFSFSWANTPYNGGSSSFAGTKYTSSDKKTTLESMDDAATVHFGSPWRMPTQAEMQELADTYNTDANEAGKTHLWKWIDNYKESGHAGYLITCKLNGKSIFLPAAGFRLSTVVNFQGEVGYYWSSSLRSFSPNNAWNLNFSSDDANMSNYNRCYGYSVRAVCE